MVELQEKMSPEEEIQKLEQQLEQKKRALTEAGVPVPEEKEVFREVIKEHIESLSTTPSQAPPQAPSPVGYPVPVGVVSTTEDEKAAIKRQEASQATIRILVEKALTGTIEEAVKEAQELGPYMLKELHNHLVDDMYDKLVALRKIKQI